MIKNGLADSGAPVVAVAPKAKKTGTYMFGSDMELLKPWRAEVKSPKVKVYAVDVLEPVDASPTDGIVGKRADGSTMVIEDRTIEDHFGEAAPGEKAREHEAPKKKRKRTKRKGCGPVSMYATDLASQ